MNTKEQWRDVVGYEGLYQVSDKGNVISLNYRGTGKEQYLTQTEDKGYMHVNLSKKGTQKRMKVHRLVAFAFLGAPESSAMVVDHINEDKSDNRVENLRWATQSENIKRSMNSQKHKYAAILQKDQYGNVVGEYSTITEAAQAVNRCPRALRHVLYGNQKTAGGYYWDFIELKA